MNRSINYLLIQASHLTRVLQSLIVVRWTMNGPNSGHPRCQATSLLPVPIKQNHWIPIYQKEPEEAFDGPGLTSSISTCSTFSTGAKFSSPYTLPEKWLRVLSRPGLLPTSGVPWLLFLSGDRCARRAGVVLWQQIKKQLRTERPNRLLPLRTM